MRETPDSVTERDAESSLGQRSVKWVPETLVDWRLLVLLFSVNGGNLTSGDRGAVQGDGTKSAGWSRLVWKRLRKKHVNKTWSTESPGVAEDWLSLAVQRSEVWSVLGREKKRHSLVPFIVRVVAKAVARFVSASDIHHPFFNARAGSRAASSKNTFVVLECDFLDCTVCDSSRTSIDRVDDRRSWNRGRDRSRCASDLSQQSLELFLELIEDRDLIGDGKCWQREDEWCDAHFCDECWDGDVEDGGE